MEEELKYQILKIDKEYKKNNERLVISACFNASVIALMGYIMLRQDANVMTTDINGIISTVEELINDVDLSFVEPLKVVYANMFEGLREIIDKLGILGICLVSKAVNLVISITKGTIKQKIMKEEIERLQKLVQSGGKENVK